MKQLFAVILVLSILSFQFSELLVYGAFKLNQDYIAENLCVEKDVEGSTCNGCCHLKKKVNEQQEQKKDLPPVQNEKLSINFCKQISVFNIVPLLNGAILFVCKQKEYQFAAYHSVFHPPKNLI